MEKIINTYEASAANGASVTVYEVQDMEMQAPWHTPTRRNPASGACNSPTVEC
ncbi:hypothetical protein [Devosia sp. 1566]|uniref:hypothetical protein n=1 Tax=Devosia sp. 1566 TaxID=2499144 RepID=UPI0013E39C26|nr:hypothetical protein [Devosia sp. 1566]